MTWSTPQPPLSQILQDDGFLSHRFNIVVWVEDLVDPMVTNAPECVIVVRSPLHQDVKFVHINIDVTKKGPLGVR